MSVLHRRVKVVGHTGPGEGLSQTLRVVGRLLRGGVHQGLGTAQKAPRHLPPSRRLLRHAPRFKMV